MAKTYGKTAQEFVVNFPAIAREVYELIRAEQEQPLTEVSERHAATVAG